MTSGGAVALQKLTEFMRFNDYFSPMQQADSMWISFQNGIVNFANTHGGSAALQPPVIHRPNWGLVKDVIEGRKPLSDISKDCPN